jgi:uncharacterized protein YcbK (DUF882 family)
MKYFKLSEFDSPDEPGSGSKMDPQFLLLLEEVREEAGIPFRVNSGYRTVARNKLDGGKPKSAHRKGKAADIDAQTNRARFKIVRAALTKDVRRIGIGKTFVHLDNDISLPQEVVWLY